MKGTFFQSPREYSLQIDGEEWFQGDTVKGTLTIKNHSAEDINLDTTAVFLAHGEIKKVKVKDPKAFNIFQKSNFRDSVLAASSEVQMDFSFDLASDCSISEKSNSLYILCGEENDIVNGGQLHLNIIPTKVITEFLQIFSNFHRFQVKTIKNKKDGLDVKMSSPDTSEMGAVEQLNLLMRMNEKNLELKYTFKVKKLAYDAGTVNAKSSKEVFDQVLTPADYLIYGDATNQDKIKQCIDEILGNVTKKTTF